MHILVTGGTGFIGKQLCRALWASGHDTTVFSRRPEQVAHLVGERCRSIGQLRTDLIEAPVDAIINLAGEPVADRHWTQARKQKLKQSRIALTHDLIDMCKQMETSPKAMISASAVGYYGDQQDLLVTEQTPPHEEFTHELCSEWEAAALSAESIGMRVAIARIGLVVGKEGFLQKMLPVFKLGLGGKFGDGSQWMPWIHIQDLLRVMLHLLETPTCSGPYNAVSPNPVTNAEFTATLAKQLHRPAFCTAPAFALKLAMGELSRMLLTGQKAIPARLLDENFSFQFDTLEEALKDVID
ncbi:predicted nucleoside-diphosphate sugar epimerase [Hahella chejuensis KCTC 2396]|uniref:Predicted nucleoside-diphosphate sugar epimerase n=1 Tax=Hahella chejuensis (strain KCTC 2396) TaxID=349521 RepID=Q2SD11_HAHCH|nr:TIGR01777 family oxidoreductase [Hahella chejuensis]ABC31463.1 predicted nucleoside-diphosphate sugar epimerase [Hahella chejuensis KCTC 2396]